MIRTLLIPLLAVAGVIYAVVTVVKGSIPPPASPPVIEPARAPYASFVAGSALVEASSENIAVGAPVGALVTKVHAGVGARVKKGDALFQLDDRELRAERLVRESQARVAEEQLRRLEAGTRSELLPPARARVSEGEALVSAAQQQLEEAQSQFARAERMGDARAMSEEEVSRRRFAVATSQARLAQARASLDEARAQVALLEAGAWENDLRVARAQLEQARAGLRALDIELDRRVVRSPVDGVVLQRNVREGEFAPSGSLASPLMLVGTIDPLHVRVDVDEHEAWRVREGARAVAFARGNKDITAPLTFVRFEPYVVPKRSLTGASTERVDTRVLQVIYSFDASVARLFVGQQVDVFIEAQPLSGATREPAGGSQS